MSANNPPWAFAVVFAFNATFRHYLAPRRPCTEVSTFRSVWQAMNGPQGLSRGVIRCRRNGTYIPSPGGRRRRHPIDHLQNRFRPQACQQVLRQVHPPNRPRLINEKLGRTRDVVSLLAAALMHHTIGSNRVGMRIGQERERIALGLTKVSRFFARIDADRHDLRAARNKFRQVLLKAP